jgi:hypothetical protein
MHDLLFMLIQSAVVTDAQDPLQDNLVSQIVYAREMGTLMRCWQVIQDQKNELPAEDLPQQEPEMESQLAITSNGCIWSDLPFLVLDLQEAWSKALDMLTVRRHILAALIARVASCGILVDQLSVFAISIFRDTPETPRRLVLSENGSEVAVS